MNPKVDRFLARATAWKQEQEELRRIILQTELEEDVKWGKPCYTLGTGNVLILQSFKESCTLMFFKGALLKDPEGILSKLGENTQGARVIRFTSVDEVLSLEPTIAAYIQEAIEAERAGLKVEYKTTAEPMPEELQAAFDQNPALQTAFTSLTPGRQRAYILHFAAPKQSKTRTSRIEKVVSQILEGRGLTD